MLAKIRNIVGIFADRLSVRRDSGPIDSLTALEYFVSTRASFVAQKTLYGYLKARMGTRYPSMFEDDVFVQSINIAKAHIFAACLSDLTIYALANAFAERSDDPTFFRTPALKCYSDALAENRDGLPDDFPIAECVERFTARLAITEWGEKAMHRSNFTESPRAILHWAPIAPNLKKQDVDIVENSINFAWSEVRQNFQKRLQRDAILQDLN